MSERSLESSVCRLKDIMAALRAKCPWDREQTHRSLRRYLIEECHEVLEAIDAEDDAALVLELGDLLFQIWFHAEVASERAGGFDLIEVIERLADKLVRRHPHVFGPSDRPVTKEELRGAWEASKLREGRRSRLEGVPELLPALLQAERFQEKAAGVGFDWPQARGVLDKVAEEVAELHEALGALDAREPRAQQAVEHEFGDLLFTLVNFARHTGIVAEDALREANARFRRRFQRMEAIAAERGGDLAAENAAGLEALWVRAKRELEGR